MGNPGLILPASNCAEITMPGRLGTVGAALFHLAQVTVPFGFWLTIAVPPADLPVVAIGFTYPLCLQIGNK